MPETICSKCVLDDTIPELVLDNQGICQFCHMHDELDQMYPLSEKGKEHLDKLVKQIRHKGKNNRYDCILGVSGGTDSTYTLYKAVELGLRPLAVHLDNGWNSEIAVRNIKNTCQRLNVDLYTWVIDWEEFKDIQLSFLRASVSDAEIPTDVAIHSILVRAASKEKVRYVLNGHSFRTEGVMPIGWTYMDGRYIRSVQKKFGRVKLKTYPNFSLKDLLYYSLIKRIEVVPFLNYFDYNKSSAKKLLANELKWEYYGGHHHESIYTRFFQSFLLPKKFNIDKRKTELSAMIRSNAIDRSEALAELITPYEYDIQVIKYVIGKLGLTQQDFDDIMALPGKTFSDYPTYFPLIKKTRSAILIACKMNLLPKLLYLKFLGVEK